MVVFHLYSVVTGSISSGGDHCWWHLIMSKLLSSVCVCCTQCLSDFLVMVIQFIKIYFCSLILFIIVLYLLESIRTFKYITVFCPVGWGCRIHQLLLCRGVTHPYECPGYDTKKSDDELPVMLEFWGMQITSSLPSLPGSLWPGVVASHRVLFMGQIELKSVFILNWIAWNWTVFTCKLYTDAELNCLK